MRTSQALGLDHSQIVAGSGEDVGLAIAQCQNCCTDNVSWTEGGVQVNLQLVAALVSL